MEAHADLARRLCLCVEMPLHYIVGSVVRLTYYKRACCHIHN